MATFISNGHERRKNTQNPISEEKKEENTLFVELLVLMLQGGGKALL